MTSSTPSVASHAERDLAEHVGRVQEALFWNAMVERDRTFDGVFVYGVATTGIYCRPQCASRRPKRGNVRFFATVDEAQGAGFRSCKRCQPAHSHLEDPSVAKVVIVCRYIEQHMERQPRLDELAALVGLSPGHMQRVFHRLVGISPKEYADGLRRERFKRLVRDGAHITLALYEAGYGSSSRLYERAPQQLGMTPASYQQQGAGECIRYLVVPSALGPLLVAATDRGVCAVRFGETPEALEAALQDEFANATLIRVNHNVAQWAAQLVRYLEGTTAWPTLPVDVRATSFQLQVWQCLRTIPEGTTATYSDVAHWIGNPKAVRAVAQACASNPVAVVIPCHRVLPKPGGSGGYRWGTRRKQQLLALEAARTDAAVQEA